MANVLAPFGFSQTGISGGSAPTFGMTTQKIAVGNSTKIFQNDPVKILSTGYIAQWTATTGASQLYGTFIGCTYVSVAQSKQVWSPYWPGADAAADAVAHIVPCSPGSFPTFLVQTNNSAGGATAMTMADIGQNIDVALGAGNTFTGISTAYADQNTQGVTATLPFRIVGLYAGVGNGSDATSANNWIFVTANVAQNTGI